MKNTISIILLALLLSSCSPSVQLNQKDSNKINSINFNEDVKIPDKAFYFGPAQGIGAIFGIVGALIADGMESNDELIVSHMKKNNINIAEIATKEFERQIRQNSRFKNKRFISNQENADATFILEVRMYGIAQTHGFSSLYRPTLGVSGKLVDKQGKTLWEYYDYITAQNGGVQGLTFKEYFSRPGEMRKKFELIAKNVVSLLLKNLQI